MNPAHHDEPGHGRHERRTALALPRRHALATEFAGAAPASEPLDQTLQLRDLLRVFLKRKWTILAIFAISATFSVVLTYLASPVYRASTTIQIERFAPRVFDYKDVTQAETYDYDSADFLNTNYELLKSRAVAERAVEDLGLRRKATTAAANAAAADGPPKASDTPPSTGEVVHEFLNRLGGGPPNVEIDPVVRQDNAVVGAFQGSVSVEPVRRSRLVRVHFDSTDPFFAAKAVNV